MSQKGISKVSIVATVFPYWSVAVTIICIIFFVLDDVKGIYSTILGSVFSLIGLRQLANDQYQILVQKKRSAVFISFILRLLIYSIPIVISLKFSNYFKFWVILICLFKSQVIFL